MARSARRGLPAGASGAPVAPAFCISVLNGTTRSGLAGDTTEQLGARGYGVAEPGNTRRASGPATIVHGPEGYLAAQSVRAQLPEAQLLLDEELEGTGVTATVLLSGPVMLVAGAVAASVSVLEASDGIDSVAAVSQDAVSG